MNNELQEIIISLHKSPGLNYLCDEFLRKGNIESLKDIKCRGIDCEQCILDVMSEKIRINYTSKLIKVIRQI